MTRLAAYPGARIYHYAPYEITALRRLTTKYGIGEAFLDRLLRERRFVDLFAVVRGALIGSEPNYSIKSMEAFYGREREGEVKTAGGSVVAYERWRETGDQQILDEIEDYNRVDCISTEELRDWLVGIRPAGAVAVARPGRGRRRRPRRMPTRRRCAPVLAASALPPERQEMLFNLGLFHKREAKPAQWAVFDSVGKDEDDLIDDLDALGGLEAIGPARAGQAVDGTHLPLSPAGDETAGWQARRRSQSTDGPATVSIEALDRPRGRSRSRPGAAKAHLLADRLTLHPDWPLNTDVIAAALRDVIADQCGARRLPRGRRSVVPRGAAPDDGRAADILDGADPVEGTIAAVARDGRHRPADPGAARHRQDLCHRARDPVAGARRGIASASPRTATRRSATC